ncbi:LysR family transcriptional regulator [Motiliproteus sp. SC1-56]|uniref:LysR family transcriptional regulator n=1 Tax=Motiliproteus sp. SC1-56 TaxID=2799565 RepID=UPI001A8C9B78|nr:LysR family transcriptional regulator [Motiliproteus sp. SC1-56]
MDLRSLRYFEAVFETGSVSAAARTCFISQPSISAAIQQLEQTLDTRLFVRHARGVTPTAEAKKLYPLSKDLTGNATAILRLFNEGPACTRLRLGLMRSIGAQRISLLLKELTRRVPNLELTLVDPDEPCDLRIIDSESVASNERFVAIWTDQYQLAIPKGYPLSLAEKVVLSDFDSLPFIQRSPCLALDELVAALDGADVSYQVRANIRTVEYAQSLVGAGVGAAFLPDWEEIRSRDDIVLKAVDGYAFTRKVGLAFKRHRANDSLVQTCAELCQGMG